MIGSGQSPRLLSVVLNATVAWNPWIPKSLVIVESPAKAKTISKFLGPDYQVEASIGHIRDLPRNAADVPAKYKGLPWARLGVDTENDFELTYEVTKKDVVAGGV